MIHLADRPCDVNPHLFRVGVDKFPHGLDDFFMDRPESLPGGLDPFLFGSALESFVEGFHRLVRILRGQRGKHDQYLHTCLTRFPGVMFRFGSGNSSVSGTGTAHPYIYAVEDRIPRVYPWLNEPGGVLLPVPESWRL